MDFARKPDVAKFFPFLLFSLLLVSFASAHVDGKNVDNLHFDLETNPDPVIEGEPVTLIVTVTDSEGNAITEGVTKAIILREDIPIVNTGPGVYEVTYTFTRFGANELDFFLGDSHSTWDNIAVLVPDNSQNYPLIALVLEVLIILGFAAAIATKKLKKSSAIQYGAILLVLVALAYSVASFYASPANEGCMLKIGDEFVIHCHQSVHVSICGNEKGFGWEAGDLGRAHTHKGDNRVHWHPGAPVKDPETLITLQNMFGDLGYALSESSVEDPESGTIYQAGEDACESGTGGVIKVYSTPKNSDVKTELIDFLTVPLEDEARIDIEYR
jgi:hypothetical protein